MKTYHFHRIFNKLKKFIFPVRSIVLFRRNFTGLQSCFLFSLKCVLSSAIPTSQLSVILMVMSEIITYLLNGSFIRIK